ncbi:MAG: hypothetical protein P1U86_09660, partial [Verrucomicrobiales bacterium]|nr:hypothetical protein [Verrucomicrobiales bacterium]
MDTKKAEALNLFEQDEKKSGRKAKTSVPAKDQGSVFGHLGKEDPSKKIAEIKSSRKSAPPEPEKKVKKAKPAPKKALDIGGFDVEDKPEKVEEAPAVDEVEE